MSVGLARSNDPIYFTDLNRCRPQSSLSRVGRRSCWRLIDYEAEDFRGVFLRAGPETAAAEVRYPLEVRGWHDVYIGLYNTPFRPFRGQRVWTRLDDDAAFSLVFLPAPAMESGQAVRDVYWKTADLTGQGIRFKQLCREQVPAGETGRSTSENVWIGYIKLVPLEPGEIEILQADLRRTDRKRLVATQDVGTGIVVDSEPGTVRDLLESYRDTDFGSIYWEAGAGDLCAYFTRLGRMCTTRHLQIDDYSLFEYRRLVENWTEYVEKGIDPFQIAVDHAHELGMEFHASYRFAEGMGPFHFSPPFEEMNQGGFYENHPELRAIRRDGSRAPRISLSYPETRRYLVSLFREMAGYPVDGICPLFNRRPPYVEYEEPLVRSFQEKYGQDPRQLEETDPRWLNHRAAVMTEFVRNLRRMLDQVAAEQGRPKKLSVWVFGRRDENLYWGLDVERWIRERLVDTVVPYTSAEGLYSWELAWEDPDDVRYWLDLTRGTSCRVTFNIMPRHLSAEQYRRKARQLYALGVESLVFWDTAKVWGPEFDAHSAYFWGHGTSLPDLRRLGRVEELEAWAESGEPPIRMSGSRLKKIGDWEMTFIAE